MRILIVYPTKLDASGAPIRYRKAFLPPLAPALLAGLTPSTDQVEVVNDIAQDVDVEAAYDLVAITAMTAQSQRGYAIADAFRRRGVPVVIGGIHATVLPDEASKHADAVAVGEVDDIWREILDDFRRGKPKPLYRADTLPLLDKPVVPRFDAMDLRIYPKPRGRRWPMLPIFTTRGCPYACDFCSVSDHYGRRFRVKPIEHVLAEIDAIRGEFYFFVDDNIVGLPDYSRELFRALIPKRVRWLSQASTTMLKHPDLIELAARAGCEMLFLGVESVNAESLRGVRKSFNKPEAYGELFARLRKAGIIPYPSIMFGFDTDVITDLRSTMAFLMKHRVGHAVFNMLTPLPGTALFQKLESEGRILHRNWSLFDMNHVVYRPKNFSARELYDEYWSTFAEFFSLRNIAKRMRWNVGISPHPGMRLKKDLGVNLAFRSMVRSKEHPYSAGLGRLTPSAGTLL